MEFYGGMIKAPKVLADIVESVMGAVFLDCGFDVNAVWVIDLQRPTRAYCYAEYVGRTTTASSSEHKENAKLQVAKAALKELFYNPFDKMDVEFVPFQRKKRDPESITFQKKKMDVEFDPTKECEGAKQKLNGLCQIEKWPKPTYRVEKEIGPVHDRRFICSVQIIIAEGMLFDEAGSRVRFNLEVYLTQVFS
ncbi:ribonuclease 3-like protein 2 [Solanum pennellii]|uniref:Ribonuclease 3-like protein 2 n=1 Tax=Solanum pennellii TaxID=28526 RepID=A0ABM1HSI7_SOLPN|nr:ribonuclease 3-like protein 2 [Solanum pennellii]